MRKLNQLLFFSFVGIATLLNEIEVEAVKQPSQTITYSEEQQNTNIAPNEATQIKQKRNKKQKKNKKNKSQANNIQRLEEGNADDQSVRNVNSQQIQKLTKRQKLMKPDMKDPDKVLEYRIEKLRLGIQTLKKRTEKLQQAYSNWLQLHSKQEEEKNRPQSVDNEWQNDIPDENQAYEQEQAPMAFLNSDHKTIMLVADTKSDKSSDALYRLSKENLEKLHKELDKYRTTKESKTDQA